MDGNLFKSEFDELIEKLNYRSFIEVTPDPDMDMLVVGKSEWTDKQCLDMGYIWTFVKKQHDVYEWAYSSIVSSTKTLSDIYK